MPPANPIRAAELDTQVVQLKAEGLTFQQTADRLNISKTYAYDCFQRARRAAIANRDRANTEYETAQLARIEGERAVVEEILHATHPVVSNGRVFNDLEDAGPKLAAIDRLVKLDAQESDLLGLKAPTRVEQSGGVRVEIIGVDPAELL